MPEVVGQEVVGENLPLHQPAGCQYAYLGTVRVGQQLFQTVGTRKDIVIHAPYPVGFQPAGLFHAPVETSRTSYVGLRDDVQLFTGLCGQPFGSAVGAAVVDDNDLTHRAVLSQAGKVALQQGQAVVGHHHGNDADSFLHNSIQIINFPGLHTAVSLHQF